MNQASDPLRDGALRWIAADPDRATRDELSALFEPAHRAELAERMSGPVRFGTAGLRAPVRAGPNGMNVAVVRRATAGLAVWLARRAEPGALVVVGRDARHGSAAFAEATASVLAGAGFAVTALTDPIPTPILAYAVRALDAAAGVQITASHNPSSDNGYKVYLGGPDGGAQLVEPADAQIEAAIAAAPVAAQIPTTPVPGTDPAPLVTGYLDRTAGLASAPATARSRLRIALTALHGVGNDIAVAALRRAGFTDLHVVTEQAQPDPDFPTVAFPNPEEPGATDLLLQLADRVEADLAIALDPDADRCALGVPGHGDVPGWRMLTGNETGALLGDHLMATLDRTVHPDPLVATTVASSRLLRAVAAARGARFAETLTGFKWIVRAGGEQETGFVYGFEEALGYCVDPSTVRDKDGIAAAVLAADLAAGGSLHTALEALALVHGVHLTSAITLRCAPDRRSELVSSLASRYAGPAPDVFVIETPGARTVIRPSGTEPKLKAYLEVVEPVANRAALPAAQSRAADRLAALHCEITALLAEGPGA